MHILISIVNKKFNFEVYVNVRLYASWAKFAQDEQRNDD